MSTERQPAPTTTTLAFHSSRIVVDVGVLIVMFAMSRSFVSAPSGNRSSLALDALPALLLVAPIFVITLIPDHTRPIPRTLGWAALVLGLAAFPFAIVKYLDSSVLASTLGGSVGIGSWLLVIGTLVTVAGIAIGLTRSAMGLISGGTPGRDRAIRPTAPRSASSPAVTETAFGGGSSTPADPSPAVSTGSPPPAPTRPLADENPFGSPLFDSLEIPAIVDAEKQGILTFETEDAGEQAAEDPED